ncbi:hypothetical protein F5879DRAFT_983090 [Lentinula edodes]|nr:hypothetical protein F5879DRAFT_983090 [Lentinula edodes]
MEVSKTHQNRLHSQELSNQNVLHCEVMPSPVMILSLVDNSLLVYCDQCVVPSPSRSSGLCI